MMVRLSSSLLAIKLCFFLPSVLGAPSTSSLDSISAYKNETSVAAPDPPGLTYQTTLTDGTSLNTLQAETLIVMTLADLALRNQQDDLQSRRWTATAYPDVAIRLRVLQGQQFKRLYVKWALYHTQVTLVERKGPRWVAASTKVYLRGQMLGRVELVPGSTNAQPGPVDASTRNVTDALNGGTFPSITSKKRSDMIGENGPTSNSTSLDDESLGNGGLNVTRGQFEVAVAYPSEVNLGEQNLYLMYSNTILALINENPFNPRVEFVIRNRDLGITLLLLPPNPPRTTPPFNTLEYSLRVISRIAQFTTINRRFTEVQALALIDLLPIQHTSYRIL